MVRQRIPKNCWSFELVWKADIYYRTSCKGGTKGMERITGETIDINEWTEFGYYELWKYRWKK